MGQKKAIFSAIFLKKLVWGFQWWEYGRAKFFHKLYVLWRASKKILRAPSFLAARAQTSKNEKFFWSIFHFFNFQNVISGRLIYEFCFGRNMLGPYAWVVVDINQFSQIGLERAESVPTYRGKWHFKSGRNF